MKTLLISGGSSGIGKACVEKYLLEGIRVINLDISPVSILHDNYKYIKTDVRQKHEIENAIDDIRKMNINIDFLIISAGKHLSANIENTDEENLMEIVNLNILGAFRLIKNIIPFMKESKYGSIVTIGSDQCSVSKNNSTIYGMSRAALLSLTRSIALDYAKYNIRANCIGAGTIETPLYRNAIEKYSKKSGIALDIIEAEEATCQPIGRVGKAEEVAELAYFLTSGKCDYITASLLPCDGGYIAR
jgi:2-keto-3-deoxy-L-fuconate dehydrogenase